MINKTEEIYLLEFWTRDSWKMNDKDLEQPLMLQDPYDSVWLKFIAILSYCGPIFLYDYGVILSTFGLRLKFLNFCLHNKKF